MFERVRSQESGESPVAEQVEQSLYETGRYISQLLITLLRLCIGFLMLVTAPI